MHDDNIIRATGRPYKGMTVSWIKKADERDLAEYGSQVLVGDEHRRARAINEANGCTVPRRYYRMNARQRWHHLVYFVYKPESAAILAALTAED